MNRRILPTLCLVCSLFVSPILLLAQDPEISDPAEGVNREIFWFNDQVDIYFMEPVASTYDDVLPETAKTGVSNFFRNLRYPSYLVSDVVQFKFTQAAEHTGRFLINTTVGLLGFIDVAEHIGLPDHKEDFGIALAYHGVPAGPYLVLPFLGPTNVRDGVGQLVDFFLDPFTILGLSDVRSGVTDKIVYPANAIKIVNTRAELLEALEAAKSSSVDYYLFLQSAYYQHRRGVLYDGNPPDDEEDPFADDVEMEEKAIGDEIFDPEPGPKDEISVGQHSDE